EPLGREFAACDVHGFGVIGEDLRALGEQVFDDDLGGRLTHVVGAGLEGQAPHAEAHAGKVLAEARGNVLVETALLVRVALFHGAQHGGVEARIFRNLDARLHVPHDTGAAIATHTD